MKRLLALFACSLCLISNLQAQTGDSATPQPAANEQQPVANRYHGTGVSDKERYRRSSLCLIMLTHRGKKYAEEMERVFKNFPLPLRYNEHNISDLRVITVKGKQEKKILTSCSKTTTLLRRWWDVGLTAMPQV